MAKIRPFKAIRPTRDKVHLVATRPYYTYKKNVLNAKLEDNPFTFLHIINPEFGHRKKSDINLTNRFSLVSEAYQDFIDRGILIQDVGPHLYLYRQTKDGHQYLGVIAAASVEEYQNDKIKKHEATITSREEIFMEYLNIVGYNAEPVLLSYSDPENHIELMLQDKIKERPEYEYTTTDRIKHELWLFSSEESERISVAFEDLDAAYIADGHHRCASSAGLHNWREKHNETHFPNEDFFLAYFLEEKRLNILEFNRFVKTLNGLSKAEFLIKLEDKFEVIPLQQSAKPIHEHQITMCLDGDWFQLNCNEEIIEEDHPVRCLDAEILTNHVLEPILDIKDLKTDENINFLPGHYSVKKIEKKIRKGKYKVGFFLFPVDMSQIKRVADNQMIMPPKSTWIEPKLRSGLTIYNINE